MARTKQTARIALPALWPIMTKEQKKAWIKFGDDYERLMRQPGAQPTPLRDARLSVAKTYEEEARSERIRAAGEEQAKAQAQSGVWPGFEEVMTEQQKQVQAADERYRRDKAAFEAKQIAAVAAPKKSIKKKVTATQPSFIAPTNKFGQAYLENKKRAEALAKGEIDRRGRPVSSSQPPSGRQVEQAARRIVRSMELIAPVVAPKGKKTHTVVPTGEPKKKGVVKKKNVAKAMHQPVYATENEKLAKNRARYLEALRIEAEENAKRMAAIREKNAKELEAFKARRAINSLPAVGQPQVQPVTNTIEFVPDIIPPNDNGTEADVSREVVDFGVDEYVRDPDYDELAELMNYNIDLEERQQLEADSRAAIQARVENRQLDLALTRMNIVEQTAAERRAKAIKVREKDRDRKRAKRSALKPTPEEKEIAKEERREAYKERRRLAAKAKRDAIREAAGPPEEKEPKKRAKRPTRPSRAYVPKWMPFVREDEEKQAEGITDRELVISRMHEPYIGETTYYRFMGVAHRMALAVYPAIDPNHDRVKTLARFLGRQEEMLRTLVIDYDNMDGNANLVSLDQIRAVDVLWRDMAEDFVNMNLNVSQGFSSLINHPRTFLTAREHEGGPLIANTALFKRAAAILTMLRFPVADGRPDSGWWEPHNLTFQSGGIAVDVSARVLQAVWSIFHYIPRVNRVFGLFRHHDYLIMNVDGPEPGDRRLVLDQTSLNQANIRPYTVDFVTVAPILIMEAVVRGYELILTGGPPANIRYFVRVELETYEEGEMPHLSGSIPFCQENYNLYRPRGEDLIQYWMENNHEQYLGWSNLATFDGGLIVHYTFINDIYGPPLPLAPPPPPAGDEEDDGGGDIGGGGENEDNIDFGEDDYGPPVAQPPLPEPEEPPPPPLRRSSRIPKQRTRFSPSKFKPEGVGAPRPPAGPPRRGSRPLRSATGAGGVVVPLPPPVVLFPDPDPEFQPPPPLRRSSRRPKPRDFFRAGSLMGDHSTKMFFKQASGYRFTSEAIFECPDRPAQTCVVMAVLRAELTIWTFDDDNHCTGIQKSTSTNHPTPPYLVPLFGPAWDVPRDLPFIYWNAEEQKSYLNLFQSRKYYDMETQCYLSGAQNESEIAYWEMAALELVSSMEYELGEPVDYNDVYSFLQQFARCFHVGVSVYDLDRRTSRIGIVCPYEKPQEWVDTEGELRMIHIVYEQGHMHAVANLSAFTKHKDRETELRDFHYCPICDAKTVRALNTRVLALGHISDCLKLDCFSDGYAFEKSMIKHSATVPVSKDFTELKKKRKFGTQPVSGRLIAMKCRKCQELMESKWAFATHRCEIRIPKTKELPSEKIWVFDIESSQVETSPGIFRHECNCFCVKRAYEDPDRPSSARTFPNELVFLEWLISTPELVDTIWIAHNAGSYDMQFILRMLERKEIPYDYVPSPNSKHKMLSLTFESFRLVDSIRFIPGSLDSIAKAFGLELAKGKFPHLFNTPERQTYVGPLPPLVGLGNEDYWGIKMIRSEKEKSTFLRWYEEQQGLYCHCEESSVCDCTLMKWDLRQELVKYCEMDVAVLAEIIRLYRDQCLQLDDDYIPDGVVHWKPPRIDPLTCMTLPQLTMKTLLLGYGEEKSPGYDFCRPMTYEPPNRGGMSFKAILWLRQVEKSTGYKIHGRWNGLREYYDWDNDSYVDGYCRETNSVYVFLECDYSGCPICLAQHDADFHILPGRGVLVEDAYKATQEYINWLQLRHQNCYVMWEHDFELTEFSDYEIECSKLMNPQDAFYGGRTEVFALYADIAKFQDESIKYHDVTSLYPSVYAHHTLPMGQPVFYLGTDVDLARLHPDHPLAYFGYVRCYIRPQSADHIGVLPFRSEEGRLTFPVRPMKGTWFTKEIHIALGLGYELLEVYEVIHWEPRERSDQHLKGYVGYFLRMKQEAEGWKKLGATSDHPSDEEKAQVSEALYHQNGQLGRIRHDRVEPNPIKRQLAKLYLNALWGKFAQRPSAQGHIYLYGDRQFFQFWHDHRINHEHTSFRVMYPGVYQAYYQYKPQFCQPVGHANVFIAAAVTAGARTVLHQRLLKIQSHKLTDQLGVCYPRILYCDTDSVIFIWPKDAEELTSVGLGHWTDEYPDSDIAQFFALAPKVYALLFNTGKQATKAKGVQLTLSNQLKLSLDAITPLLNECAHTGPQLPQQTPPQKIQLDNFNIYSNSISRIHGYATMFSRYNFKDMRIIITKRKVHVDLKFEVGVSSMLYTLPLST